MPDPLSVITPALELLGKNVNILPAMGKAVEDLQHPDQDEIDDVLVHREMGKEITAFAETPEPSTNNIYKATPPLPRTEHHLFRFFIDGSLRTYFLATGVEGTRTFPIELAQIGASVIERDEKGRLSVLKGGHKILLLVPKGARGISDTVWEQLKREVASVFDVDSFAPFNLRGIILQRLSKERLAKGQSLALVVGEGLIELDRSVGEYLKDIGWADRGSRWPDYLNELTWLRDKVLLDYLHPCPEGLKPHEELLAREVLSIVEKGQESHGSKKLRDDLRDMNPPLTWGEVVYHFMQDPENTKGKRGRTLQEFLSLFRKRYCLECDELFTGPKSGPRLTCPRCSNKLRKRRERAKKGVSLLKGQGGLK
jgi:hypothetical protein